MDRSDREPGEGGEEAGEKEVGGRREEGREEGREEEEEASATLESEAANASGVPPNGPSRSGVSLDVSNLSIRWKAGERGGPMQKGGFGYVYSGSYDVSELRSWATGGDGVKPAPRPVDVVVKVNDCVT